MSIFTPDRFDFEQAILAMWSTQEDIDLITERYLDGPQMTEDEVANALIGLSALHDMRCRKAFEMFERMISSGKIK
jgi:hypothetical protein